MNPLNLPLLSRLAFTAYFLLLSWQLLTPVTVVNPGSWDKLIHFFGFFALAALAVPAGWKLSLKQLGVVLIVYAALTEIFQHFIPGRSFSVADWLADSLGILVALGLGSYFTRRVYSAPE